jgi:hypothetical protein
MKVLSGWFLAERRALIQVTTRFRDSGMYKSCEWFLVPSHMSLQMGEKIILDKWVTQFSLFLATTNSS